MKVDTFTKIVLTVIAINLSILTLKNIDLIPKAYANEPSSNLNAIPSSSYGLVPINEDGSISVRLNSFDEIDVNLVGIETKDELHVNISEVGGKWISFGGSIPVQID